ncbi:hypothetical protein [Halosimplex salinum]|uniref:hypothetical protein n=1 Tax=Halosimplex salinum TaxID=1710538 RepID=UPI0013DE74C8|nr:hypothetical protein [Halosimplex salinum]
MSDNVVTCDGETLRLPNVDYYLSVDSSLVLELTDDAVDAEPDVPLPSASRNVAKVDPHCRVDWFVQEPDERDRRGVDEFAHTDVRALGDRVITRGTNDRYFEIDLETGAIADSWPNDAFVVGGTRVEFEHAVERFELVDGVRVVVTGSDDEGADVYGFDGSGTELWRRSDPYEWHVRELDGDVQLYDEVSMGMRPSIRVDPRTGAEAADDRD